MSDEPVVNNDIERRTHTVEMTISNDKKPMMVGYAANFNSVSEDLGGFREVLATGCFTEAIKTSDCRALFNHNPDLILGRTVSGTLKLTQDDKGLRFEVHPPDTSYANDLKVSMVRGDISACSFGFTVADGGDTWERQNDGSWIRSIHTVDRLFDVSPVTFPAYPSTACALRSLERVKGEVPTRGEEELIFFDVERLRYELDLMG